MERGGRNSGGKNIESRGSGRLADALYIEMRREEAAGPSGKTGAVSRPCEVCGTRFDGIEEVLCMRAPAGIMEGGRDAAAAPEPVTRGDLEGAGMSAEDAWEAAERNVREDSVVTDVGSVLLEKFGIEMEKPEEAREACIMVATNRGMARGAAAVRDGDAVMGCAERIGAPGTRFVVMPSSIHEMFLVPAAMFAPEDCAAVMKDVNGRGGIVGEGEALGNAAFTVDFRFPASAGGCGEAGRKGDGAE